jgi:hypothetical protein
MAVELFDLAKLAISRFEAHSDSERRPQFIVSRNLLRASIWGTVSSGATALASFIFSKTLTQESIWKTVAPHVYDASLMSCGTFAAFAGYFFYTAITAKKKPTDDDAKALNERVSNSARRAAMVGYLGSVAAWVSTKPLEKHLYSFVGLGVASSVLWLIHTWQNKQLAIMNEKNKSDQS